MNKSLKYICVQPRLSYYVWQLEVMLTNFIKNGVNPIDVQVLIACSMDSSDRTNQQDVIDLFNSLSNKFGQVNFFYYKDTRIDPCYISSVRPNILKQHFKEFPDLKNKNIFYHDCDIVFTKTPDFDRFLQDDIWYLSDTVGYIGSSYIRSKGEDIYLKMCNIIGIDPEIPKLEEVNSGGAQYLMKNITYDFWSKVERDSELLYSYLSTEENRRVAMNPSYHPIQKWTSDMWAVLWNGWYFNHIIKTDKYLDFTWATESITKWEQNLIYHNAGVVGKGDSFFKGEFQNKLPYFTVDTFNRNLSSYNYYKEVVNTGQNSCLVNSSK